MLFDLGDFEEGGYLVDWMKWSDVFISISMPKADVFLPEIGLELRPTNALRQIAQDYVYGYFTLLYGYDIIKNSPYAALLEPSFRYYDDQLLLFETFKSMLLEVGPDITQGIYEWGIQAFRRGDEFYWREILLLLGFRDERPDNQPFFVPLELPNPRLLQVREITRLYLEKSRSLRQSILTIEQSPRSSWEEYVYSMFTKGCSPWNAISNEISDVNIRSILRNIVGILDQQELAIFKRWAIKQSESLGLGSESLELPTVSISDDHPN